MLWITSLNNTWHMFFQAQIRVPVCVPRERCPPQWPDSHQDCGQGVPGGRGGTEAAYRERPRVCRSGHWHEVSWSWSYEYMKTIDHISFNTQTFRHPLQPPRHPQWWVGHGRRSIPASVPVHSGGSGSGENTIQVSQFFSSVTSTMISYSITKQWSVMGWWLLQMISRRENKRECWIWLHFLFFPI